MSRKTLDPARSALRQVEAQQADCPRCKAAAGTPCRSLDTKPVTYHAERHARWIAGW